VQGRASANKAKKCSKNKKDLYDEEERKTAAQA